MNGTMTDLIMIGVPYWLGGKEAYSGSVDMARDRGIADEYDIPWVEIVPDFETYEPVVAVNRAIVETMRQHEDKLPLVLVGDCTSSWGVLAGLQTKEPQVLWYDAHGDFNTPETSPSGFLGGMPLAAMVGMGNQEMVGAIGLDPIPENRVTLVDGRDLDPEEAELVENSALRFLKDVADVQQIDWNDVPVYLHFDNDVLHLDDVPAVSYPAEGGPHLPETIASVRHAVQQADIQAVSFTLWNASKPGAEQSAEATLSVVRAVIEGLRA